MESTLESVNRSGYKVCILNAYGKLSKVIAFLGDKQPLTIDNSIFSPSERRFIERDRPELIMSAAQIHPDDTTGIIKKKLVNELGSNTVSYDELYLFIKRKEPLDLKRLYRAITLNETRPLTKAIMGQLLANMEMLDATILNYFNQIKGTVLTYKDLVIGFNSNIESVETFVSLGQQLSSSRDMIYSANPYRILSASPPAFQLTVENQMLTFENQLLLSYGRPVDNTIYVSMASDVFDYASRKSINPTYMVELYYPFLKKRNISDKIRLNEERPAMMMETKEMLTKHALNMYKSIDLFYDIQASQPDALPYNKNGIYAFDLTLHPSVLTNTPLDYIFKQLHASEKIPYLKFSPGVRREEIYKLYSIQRTKTGKKIPFLKRTVIMNLSKQTGRKGGLSLITYHPINDRSIMIYVDVSKNGDISVRAECKDTREKYKEDPLTPISVSQLEEILRITVNPIIQTINVLLESSGYAIISFQGLDDELLEYNAIQYGCDITIRQKILSSDINSLLSGAFNIVENNIGTNDGADSEEEAILRFKRVNNYKEMDAVNALITETYQRTNNIQTVVLALESNFQMTDETARLKITEYLNGHILLNGKYVNKSIDIAENPGFLCIMHIYPFDNKLDIKVSGINSIYYIEILQTYIDGFLRLTQYPSSTPIQKETLIELLSVSRSVKPSVRIENVIAPNAIEIRPIQFRELDADEDDESDEEAGIFFEDDDEDENDDDNDLMGAYDAEDENADQGVPENEQPPGSENAQPPGSENAQPPGSENAQPPGSENEQTPGSENGQPPGSENEQTPGSENEQTPGSENEQTPGSENDDSDEDVSNLFKMNGGTKLFFNKMKKLEPTLFRTKKEGMYESYARLCPSSSSRQPVILTDEEKKQLDDEHPGSYEIAMKYGTDPAKPNWYICPRYWCVTTNRPLTEEQVLAGECGGKIVPRDAKKPPPGHYIYEFTDEREHIDLSGNYRTHRPGILPIKSHPTSCVPCCFKRLDTEPQIKRRNQCNISKSDYAGDPAVIDELVPEDDTATRKDRIQITVLSYDRKILDPHRWGFLPLSVELFLQTDNSKSTSDKNPAVIRDNEQPILRYGVEYSKNQSFIACIADAYTFTRDIPVPSIAEMKDIILQRITIDLFIKGHNGSLVSNFRPRKMFVDDVMVEKYRSSELYQSILNMADPAQNTFLKHTIAAYENFLSFLSDKDSFIDHTYLWDLITSAETNLFAGGINLVIMEMVDSDNTDNISLLCPTNSSSDKLYDPAKGTLMMLKRENLYEPVYCYGNTKDRRAYTTQDAVKIFNRGNIPADLIRVIKMIESVSNKYCKSSTFKTAKVYEYAQNLPAADIYRILQSHDYIVDSQVVNYRGKVIGLSVLLRAEDAKSIYIPTMPSSLIRVLKRVFIDDVRWLPYETTRDLLYSINRKTGQKILCMPMHKVIEDGLIVGILTQTNQFLQLSDNVEDLIEDGLESVKLAGYKANGYYSADKTLETGTGRDDLRIKVIRNISLENQFYLAFRNKIRLLLNDYMFKEVRDTITSTLDNPLYLYSVRLQKVIVLLKYLLSLSITFVDISDEVLNSVENMKTFANNENVRAICLANNQQGLCLPVKNLISGEENEELYYARAADELIRYNRIRKFMLDPEQYLNISTSEAVVYDTEVILLQSTINSGYFDNMIPFETNKYVKNIDHFSANPMNSENMIRSDIRLSDQIQGDNV
jgi:hypothetical protein